MKSKSEGMTAQPESDLAADSAAGLTTIDFLDVVTQDDTTNIDWIDLEEPRPSSEAMEIYQNQLASLLIHEDNSEWWSSLTSEGQMEYVVRKARQTLAGVGVAERFLLIGNQNKLRQLVHRGQEREAAALLNTTRKPLDRLKQLLWVMEKNYIPSYDLCNETSEVVQAVEYLVASNRSKIYKYRGLAIRALSENVANETIRSSDLTIGSILMFMAMEVQNSSLGDWRSHAHGMKRLIDMRGGFENLLHSAPYLTSSLVIFIIIVTFSNCLGPGVGQINITEPLEQHLKEVDKVYSLLFPYILCPPTLFNETIRINHLRQEIAASPFENSSQQALYAHDILARIEAFVPEDWAQPGDHNRDWQRIGSIYQSSVALYCTMSLQALDALPSSLEMDTMRAVHGARLEENLRATTQSKILSKFSLFPLCILGVESGYNYQQTTRIWIERRLEELSRMLGTSSPLKARAVLRRYWARGKPGWDECFDGPYVFIL
ncbi:hypothetical protein E8E13_011407 [Curvularia kusanoi]|uniref:Uncharacterized protein n=1 Tax=Curvularia kusanoi TaxID=90978 RepID=A0A9P4WEM0_CURKU|nr:hypothetical protein E8E13_011407 [Curvularia kusanoi]